jgi:hypothetical protein
VFTASLPHICWPVVANFTAWLLHVYRSYCCKFAASLHRSYCEFASYLPRLCCKFAARLHLIYRVVAANLPRGCCKFAAILLLVCYKIAAGFLDICCMYSYKLAAISLQFCHVFAWSDRDYDIYREFKINYTFQNPKLGI